MNDIIDAIMDAAIEHTRINGERPQNIDVFNEARSKIEAILNDVFDAGFEMSSEGYNGEYPGGTTETHGYRSMRARIIRSVGKKRRAA